MKLTNIQMDNHLQNLKSISGKVTGKLAYAVARNMRKISEELVEYQSLKDKAIYKHGEKNEDGSATIKSGSEGYAKFMEEMKEIMDISHDIDIQTITENDLCSSSLNADEILRIDFMIEEVPNE